MEVERAMKSEEGGASVSPSRPPGSPFGTAGEGGDQRELKRDALLLAAARMFNERGFHATSLDDVAASLGVTKPVIYHYLGNKDQVLFECVRNGLRQMQEAADRAGREPGTGLERLKAFLCRFAEVNMSDFGSCVIRTAEESLSPESRVRLRALKGEIDRAMRGLIEEAVRDDSVRCDDVRLTAFTFAGALNWTARWYRPDGPQSAAELAHAMVELLCRSIAR